MRLFLGLTILVLAGCESNRVGSSGDNGSLVGASTFQEITKDKMVVVLDRQPLPTATVRAGDNLSITYLFQVPELMVPASAGIVYVREDGADGLIFFNYIPFLDKPSPPRQETQNVGVDNQAVEFMRGHEINAVFFIGQKDLGFPYDPNFIFGFRPPEAGYNYHQLTINWSRVAYKEFISLGYHLNP